MNFLTIQSIKRRGICIYFLIIIVVIEYNALKLNIL